VDEVAAVIGEFRPDVVITFGSDGGYGHPDHVTISAVTTAACQRAADPGHRADRAVTRPPRAPPRLYYRCFPPGDVLILERLATWLTSRPSRFAGTPAFAHALLLLAEAAGTMHHVRDHVQVRWYPPGLYVVEQGEAAAELFLILSGEAEVWQEGNSGRREQVGRLEVGQFFGELGIANRRPRNADVIASTSMVSCDVSEQVMRKVEALSAYRSQLPLEPGMFPDFLLQEMFGREHFVAATTAQVAHPDEAPPVPVHGPGRSAPPTAVAQRLSAHQPGRGDGPARA
jgi:LmbE family N-acetylglucosaminyl deacetylase